MLNTYMRDIIDYTFYHPEYTSKVVPALKEIAGTDKETELWLSKVAIAAQHRDTDDFDFIFKKFIEAICRKVDTDGYTACYDKFNNIPDTIFTVIYYLKTADNIEAILPEIKDMIYLLPDTGYTEKDFMSDSLYRRMSRLYRLCYEVVKYYDTQSLPKLELIREKLLDDHSCTYVDYEGCGLAKLKNATKARMLEQGSNIYLNWKPFCRLAQAYYAYLVKSSESGDPQGMYVSAFEDLISHETVSNMGTWVPTASAPSNSNVGDVSKKVGFMELLCDIVDFATTPMESVTEHDIAVNTIKAVAIGANLTTRNRRRKVTKLLKKSLYWHDKADTVACRDSMLEVCAGYIEELRNAKADVSLYENVLRRAANG